MLELYSSGWQVKKIKQRIALSKRLAKRVKVVGNVIPFEAQLWTLICYEALLITAKI
jgi:hypothetical protein